MAVIPQLNVNCDVYEGTEDYRTFLNQELVRLAVTDIGLLNGILLAACRHLTLYHRQQQVYTQLATHFKLASLRIINATISEGPSSVRGSTVANVIMLACDEV
jgi:hypothetical protein